MDEPDAGGDALLAGEVLRVGERPEAGGQGSGEAVGIIGELGEPRTDGLGRLAMSGDECDGPLRDLAAGRGLDHGAASTSLGR